MIPEEQLKILTTLGTDPYWKKFILKRFKKFNNKYFFNRLSLVNIYFGSEKLEEEFWQGFYLFDNKDRSFIPWIVINHLKISGLRQYIDRVLLHEMVHHYIRSYLKIFDVSLEEKIYNEEANRIGKIIGLKWMPAEHDHSLWPFGYYDD